MGIGSRIPLDLVQPIEGHIKFVRPGKLEHQEVAVKILNRQAAKSLIFRNAILHVDDIVADVQILQRGEKRGRLALGLRFVASALGEEFFFGQHHEAQIRETENRPTPRR